MDIIYILTDTITGLKYLGSKKNWQGPGTYFGSPNCKSNRFKKYELQQTWKQAVIERPETISIEILESYECVEHNFLLEREYFWQKQYNVVKLMAFINAGFAKKGYCGNIYGGLTIEEANRIKEKISKTLNENYSLMTKKEKKEKYGMSGNENANFGNYWTGEQKEIASIRTTEYYKNNIHPYKGKTFEEISEEDKAKELRNNLSRLASQRTEEANPFYGKKHTDETKLKISETHKGKIITEETKEKQRKANKGKKPVNTKYVKINEIIYFGTIEASLATGINARTIRYRIKSKNPKYENYSYVESNKIIKLIH